MFAVGVAALLAVAVAALAVGVIRPPLGAAGGGLAWQSRARDGQPAGPGAHRRPGPDQPVPPNEPIHPH
jgi:hypothetical protein